MQWLKLAANRRLRPITQQVDSLLGLGKLSSVLPFGGNAHGASHDIALLPTNLSCRRRVDCGDPANSPEIEVQEVETSWWGGGTVGDFSAMATVLLAGSLSPAMVVCTSRMPHHSLVQHSQSFCPVTNLARGPGSASITNIMLEKHLHEEIWRLQGHDNSDFTEKRDVEQTKSLSPESAHEQADCAMGTAVLATVLPGFKFIHATAVVHPIAVLGKGVVISAFCTVGPAITLGIGCKLHAGSHVCGNTIIGDYCEVPNSAVVGSDIPGQTVIGHNYTIGYNAVVGIKCQDMKYKEGGECSLYIGDNNDIREHVSIHRSSKPNDDTVIGDNNLIMGSCHIAHDCKLGNHNILANATLLGGHVILKDYVHTGAAVAVHQFCHVDSYSFLAGGSMVDRDVPMYMMVSGDRTELQGLNLEGLRQCGFSDPEVKSIRWTYQKLFMNSDTEAGGLEDRLATLELDEALANVPAVVLMLRSVQDCFGEKRRGICKFRHWSSI